MYLRGLCPAVKVGGPASTRGGTKTFAVGGMIVGCIVAGVGGTVVWLE